ncbi:hypothetical protein TNCV_224581 [Trichonephila clavipes]|nr:hypothetical protein TNCV_224581 [Trichonephila clavipes]
MVREDTGAPNEDATCAWMTVLVHFLGCDGLLDDWSVEGVLSLVFIRSLLYKRNMPAEFQVCGFNTSGDSVMSDSLFSFTYIQGDLLPDRQTCRVCRGIETTRNPIGMRGRKCRGCELWCKEAEKKKKNKNSNT